MTVRYGLPLAAIVLAVWFGFDAWRASRAVLKLLDPAGAPLVVEGATVEFFRYLDEPWAPSPTERLGAESVDGTAELVVGSELVPGEALVRVSAPGRGVAFGFARLGGEPVRVTVGAPRSYEGVVVQEGGNGVPDARIEVFGGGPRGVLLAETRTDADGHFVAEGISDTVLVLTFRATKSGFGAASYDWTVGGADELVVRTQPTRPCRGRIVADGVEAYAGLDLRVLSLPGVETRIADDGTFELDILPTRYGQVYLVVPELPEGETFRQTVTRAGDEDVRIEVLPSRTVSGQVLNGYSESPLEGAIVMHEHGPRGREIAVTDGSGRFRIDRVPPGPVVLIANAHVPRGALPPLVRAANPQRRVLLQGSQQIVVVPTDEEPENVVIRVE